MGNDVFKKNIVYRMRSIGSDAYLFGDGKAYKLNKVAEDIWKNVDGKKSVYDITNVIAVKYDKSEQEIMDDILDFLRFGEEISALRRKEK